MIPTKKPGAKRGRKPKDAADKAEQLTIRLTPKLKFGLEMLARAQGRSLSQSVEWAIHVGLRRFEADGLSVGDVLDEAWIEPTEPERLLKVWELAPSTLSFEDRATCEFIMTSPLAYGFEPSAGPVVGSPGNPDEHLKSAEQMEEERIARKEHLLSHWETLRALAIELANNGHTLKDQDPEMLGKAIDKLRKLQRDSKLKGVGG